MRDEVRLEKIVNFCTEPRRAKEIMDEFGVSENVAYKCLRELRAEGYMKKIRDFSEKNYVGATYQATDKKFVRSGLESYTTGVTICGVRF